jgi:hypothetical protein
MPEVELKIKGEGTSRGARRGIRTRKFPTGASSSLISRAGIIVPLRFRTRSRRSLQPAPDGTTPSSWSARQPRAVAAVAAADVERDFLTRRAHTPAGALSCLSVPILELVCTPELRIVAHPSYTCTQ